MKRKAFQILSVILCFLALILPVFAQGTAADLDLDRTGSITLTVKDKDGVAATGGSIACIQVARVRRENGNLIYALTNGFEKTSLSLDAFVDGTESASDLAKKAEKALPARAAKKIRQISGGKVTFSDLELGLYLIRQQRDFKSHSSIQSFLVTLPMNGSSGWVYEVSATPKVGTVSRTAPPKTPTGGKGYRLPQTGQLNWPVPVLAVSGLVVFSLGWWLSRQKHEEDRR